MDTTNQSRTTMTGTQQHEPISHRIVVAVADRAEVKTNDLPRLYDSIDPDALNAMVEHGGQDLRISFSFAGYEVVVDDDTVHVEQKR
ncbi:HalOD1 output domain-containing protein [Haladaptatus caseinilyticus]|uniref:HalOD1 output domain-containing protein n=1 Tax=Haladaptatus caseinilyticus TaxID=2993314 RepID=UPI00224B3254|nr:HalOD1 output domain-containing protein [Haladaptatus caseinilyticus]